jgi:hypothetical protein
LPEFLFLKVYTVCSSEMLVNTYSNTLCSNTEEYNLNFHPVLNQKSHPILCSFYASLNRIYKSGHDKHGLWNDRLEMEGISEEQTVMVFPSVALY